MGGVRAGAKRCLCTALSWRCRRRLPERARARAVYNNALLDPDLRAPERTDALDAMEAAYTTAGVDRYAAWVHESDGAMRHEVERRGYEPDVPTRAMGMALEDLALTRPKIELATADWSECLRLLEVPPGLLSGARQSAFHVRAAAAMPRVRSGPTAAAERSRTWVGR